MHVQQFYALVGTAGLQTAAYAAELVRIGFKAAAVHEQDAAGFFHPVKQPFNPAIIFSLHRRKIRCRTIVSKIVNKSYSVRHPETIMTFSAFFLRNQASADLAPKSPQIRFPENRQTVPTSHFPTSQTAKFRRANRLFANGNRSHRKIPQEQPNRIFAYLDPTPAADSITGRQKIIYTLCTSS